jgi:hypothetical protein
MIFFLFEIENIANIHYFNGPHGMKKIKTRFLNYFSVKKNVSRKKYLFLYVKKTSCVG